MAEYFAGGHLRFLYGEWRDDDGDVIEVAPVRLGRWEERDDGFGGTYYHCSVCDEDWCTIDGTPA